MAYKISAKIVVDKREIEEAKKAAISAVVDRADKLRKILDVAKAVVRDILPATDLGRTNENWVYDFSAVTNSEQDLINTTMHNQKIVAFYGVRIKNANIQYLRFYDYNGATKAIIGVSIINAMEEPILLFYDYDADKYVNILYDPNKPCRVSAYVISGASDSEVELLGVVLDATGTIISA